MNNNYPEGDTHDATLVPSGMAFPDMDPGAPDDRGFSAPSGAFWTGPARIDADGHAWTRASGPGDGGASNGGGIDGGGA